MAEEQSYKERDMTPEKYTEGLIDNEYRGLIYGEYLTQEEKDDASELLDVALSHIGRKVGEKYEDVDAECVEVITALESFLITFIRHCSDLRLVERFLRGPEN